MIAGVILDIAWLVISVAVFVVVIVLIVLRQFKSFTIQAGNLSAKLEGMDTKVEQINRAVNHVPVGTPTLVERVTAAESRLEGIEQHQHWERRALQTIGQHVGCTLPEIEQSTRPRGSHR